MPDPLYVIAALALAGTITIVLRAIPFLVLQPLRESRFVRHMALWMPAGLLLILAAATFRSSAFAEVQHFWETATAAAITVVVHLAFGRRTLLSVGAGTATFVALVNLL